MRTPFVDPYIYQCNFRFFEMLALPFLTGLNVKVRSSLPRIARIFANWEKIRANSRNSRPGFCFPVNYGRAEMFKAGMKKNRSA